MGTPIIAFGSVPKATLMTPDEVCADQADCNHMSPFPSEPKPPYGAGACARDDGQQSDGPTSYPKESLMTAWVKTPNWIKKATALKQRRNCNCTDNGASEKKILKADTPSGRCLNLECGCFGK